MSDTPKQADMRPRVAKAADRLRFIEAAMKEQYEGVGAEAREYERKPLELALPYMLQLRDLVAVLEDMTKYAKKISADWEGRVIPTKMDAALTTSQTIDGYRVVVSEKAHASVNADRKEDAYAWLRKNDIFNTELSTLLIETVNASTLTASLKDAMRTRGIEFPEELFNLVILPSVAVTKVGAPKSKK